MTITSPWLLGSCLVLASAAAVAQTPQPQAFYPLQTDLVDAQGFYGPVTLLGSPAPAAPTNNSGVCTNGIYRFSGQPGWTEMQTPDIAGLDQQDFQINVEFSMAALPATAGPVLMGGNGWRWIGIYLQPTGEVGIKYNNSNRLWSGVTLSPGTWYAAELKHELGSLELYIDGVLVLQQTIPALNTNSDFDFMPTDYSNGTAFNGCLRNLLICNDTTLGSPMVGTYGAGCGPSTGGPVPAIGAQSLPVVGNGTFGVTVSDGPASSPAFLVLALARANITVGPGCNQLLAVPLDTLAFALADANGDLSIPVPIPGDPALVGLVGYFQWVLADPNGPVRGTFTLSEGLAVEVY